MSAAKQPAPAPTNGIPTVLTVQQAAAVARLNPHTVRGWVDRGKLPARQDAPNATRFIRRDDFVAACEKRGIDPDWNALLEFM